MANDRLYLECRNCGKITLLLKYYPYGKSFIWSIFKLITFLLRHLECSRPTQTLNEDRCFNIFAESGDYYDSVDWSNYEWQHLHHS